MGNVHALRRAVAGAGAVLITAVLTTTPASAAIVAPHFVTVGPNNGPNMSLEGYAGGAKLTITVIRNGITIGTAKGTADGLGNLLVNPAAAAAPGVATACFTTATPEILPGDTVSVKAGVAPAETLVVQDVAGEDPVADGADVIVHGTAMTGAGAALRPADLTVESFSPTNRFDSPSASKGGQTLAATSVRFDAPGSARYTARFSGLTAHDRDVVLGVGTLQVAADPGATGTSQTLFEAGGTLGSFGNPCIQPLVRNAVTGADRAVVDRTNVGTNLVLSGLAQPSATAVTVTLDDSSIATAPVTAPATLGPAPADGSSRTWTATIPAASVAALADGALTASGAFTLPAGVISGARLTLPKNTAPPPVVAPLPAAPVVAPVAPLGLHVAGIRARDVKLSAVRRRGLRLTFTMPAGSRVAVVYLRRAGKLVARRVVHGTGEQRVRFTRRLHAGTYVVSLSTGATAAKLFAAGKTTVRIVR
jgi:hypothetical protein